MKLIITKKTKQLEHEQFMLLIDDYIKDSYSGKRRKKNGLKINQGTIRNYEYLQKSLISFYEETNFEIKLYIHKNLTQKEKDVANKYHKKLYDNFTSFMYKSGYYDNYVGLIIKCLRSFYNYLITERNIDVGSFHKSFYVPIEDIPIIALTHEQLQYIIYDKEFNNKLDEKLLEIKDIFVFGCTVALRVSDLLSLTKNNLVIQGKNYYLKVKSIKTGTYTNIKLPEYAIDIIKKYQENKGIKLLPEISIAWFNKRLKEMAKYISNDFEIIKTRERRGKQVIVYKNKERRTHYKLSDHITTHTMRRTAITVMLSLGMPEHLVRKISGHAANSKEFFRYVELSQKIIDIETDKVFEKISDREYLV